MARLFLVSTLVAAIAAGCSADTATQQRHETEPNPPMQPEAVAPAPAAVTVPDNPADRGIRRDLSLAIARDEHLQLREISFVVANGDVSATGIVRTEEERRIFNDIAMNIDGVKSVANALRVEE